MSLKVKEKGADALKKVDDLENSNIDTSSTKSGECIKMENRMGVLSLFSPQGRHRYAT